MNKENTENNSSTPDREIVADESAELLSNENIITSINNYQADSKEKELAAEFVSSYVQFIQELTKHDIDKGIGRTDFEIKDLVSHVNMMMKQKNEYLFSIMVLNSSIHYRAIQKSLLQEENESEDETSTGEQ